MANGLIGYWKLDETSGTSAADSTGYGNTGTYVNSPTLNVAPPAALTFPSRAVTFNGSSQYVSGFTSPAAMTSISTISLWIYPTTSDTNYRCIFGSNSNNGDINSWYRSGTVTLIVINSAGTQYTTTATASLNTWTHFVFKFDGTYANIYKNGTYVSQVAWTGTVFSYTGKENIGYGVSSYFAGSIDDVRIYNRALTEGEISGLYAGSIQPLKGAWSVIRGNPTAVAIDSSGNNNTGTYIGSPSPCNAPPALIYDKLGTGVTFNGSSQGVSSQALGQYISTTLDVSNLPSKTYAGWFYWSSLANNWQGMVGQADGFDNSKTTGLITDTTNKINIYQAYGGGVIGFVANAALAPTLNTWYHIAGVIDKPNNRIQLYINGSSVSSPSVPTMASSSFTTISNKVGIGFMLGGGSYKFNGSVDDVRIYNRALTSGEIATLASGSIGATDSTLKAWYKFNTNKQSKI